jgi:hypothetical protein
MLNALTIIDGGDEMDLTGAARIHVEDYLSQAPFLDPLADADRRVGRGPIVIDGEIAISSTDFRLHMIKTSGETYSIPTVVSMLVALGARHHRSKAGPSRDQSRWLLPAHTFPASSYLPVPQEEPNA